MDRRAWRRLAISAAWWLAALPSVATTYYVSPTGDDGNAGTSSSAPLRSINTAIGRAGAGDTIHLIAGSVFVENVYFAPGSGGTSGSPKTLTTPASDPATVKPTGTGSTGCYIYNTGHLTISNIKFVGAGMDLSTKDGVMAYADNGAHDGLSFLNLDVSGFGATGIVIGGWGGTHYGFQNTLIQDCRCHDNRKGGISSWGQYPTANQNLTVRGCSAYNNLGDPNATSHTGSGIVLGNLTGGLIEHCIAFNNGGRCTTTGGPVGIWCWDSTNVTIQFCEAYQNHAVNCDGGGFDLDGGCQGCVIQYCYSHDNDGPGYLLCQYSGARAFTHNAVRYNISENDGRRNVCGIQFWSAGSSGGIQSTHVYGNTVYNAYAPAAWYASGGISGCSMRNNLLMTANGKALVQGTPATSAIVFQGNLYWASGSTVSIAGYSSLEAWRTATGQEQVGGTPSGLQTDPRLTNPGAGVTIGDTTQLATLSAYRLHANSPCLERGLDLLSLFGISPGSRDFYGNALPQGAALDVGAHECPQAVIAVPVRVGYTLVALPLEPSPPGWKASDLAQSLADSGMTCTRVLRYNGTGYDVYTAGGGGTDFDIKSGEGYFVRCTDGGDWSVTGYRFTSSGTEVSLETGYNLVALSLETSTPDRYTASVAVDEIAAQGGEATRVMRYNGTGYDVYTAGGGGVNFTLDCGSGYFIRCTTPSAWTVTR